MTLNPGPDVVQDDVEFWGDWEGGGGFRGKEGQPQLFKLLSPGWTQLEPKDCLIDPADLEENIHV